MKKKQKQTNEPPPDVKARLLALFNEFDDPDRLVEVLDPDGTESFTKAAVETILAAKNNRPNKRFTQFAQIQNLLTDKNTVEQYSAVLEQFYDQILFRPTVSHPILLLPVRLETHFTSDKLQVRIYPDQISIHSHDKALTPAEYEAAKTYSESLNGDVKHAWRILSSRFGPARASWIARWAETHDFKSNDEAILTQKNIRMPQLAALPDEYWVFAFRYDKENQRYKVTMRKSERVRSDRTIIGEFENLEEGQEGLFDERSKWMYDFNDALKNGLAVEIPLTPTEQAPADLREGCDRLIVVGIKRTSPKRGQSIMEDLIDAHHYSNGLGFIESGTPTNNTDEVRSSFSTREDHDNSYNIEIEGPANWETLHEKELQRTNAHLLATALGINPERFRHLEGAGSRGNSYAREMNTIVWTVTGEYYFNYLLPGILTKDQLKDLRAHVRDFVWGGGSLPAIRVGRQPYGVLPVTEITGGIMDIMHQYTDKVIWSFWNADSNAESDFDLILRRIVAKFYPSWWRYAKDHHRVPRVGVPESDPDETLLRILSMEPHSVSYQARPYVDEGFIALLLAALRNYVFGPDSAYKDTGLSPVEWMAEWAKAWEGAQEKIADFLSNVSGLDKSAFYVEQESESEVENTTKPLLKILGWGKGEEKPIEMVRDPKVEISPSEYLAKIYRSSPTEFNTLLEYITIQAIKLAQGYPEELQEIHEEIKKAVRKLSSIQVLSFFNSVTDPEQIVQQIKDDPSYHAEKKGYGIRRELATRILAKRKELGGQFTSIDQIEEVYRIGEDTMHDILYSFREDKAQVDIERLFSESLDIASHRVDAWVTSFAAKRLKGIRDNKDTSSGIYLGAYGFVEDLKPRGDKPTSAGYIHAPSAGQAATGAVLCNAFLTHDPKETADTPELISDVNPFHINLTSERVRNATRILEGIRQGQPLGALIGFQFERALRDHAEPLQQYIHDFRESFPLVAHKVTPAQNDESDESVTAEAVAARNVADGVAIIRDFHGGNGTEGKVQEIFEKCEDDHDTYLQPILESLSNTLDAVGDILMHESVYQSVQGNFERAGAVFEAASGNKPPPELESIKTEVPYRSMHCMIGMLFNETLDDSIGSRSPDDPRGAAEPRIAAWFDSVLGASEPDSSGVNSMKNIGIVFEFWEEETDPDVLSLINVNTATEDELVKLPNIGKDLAENIIEKRSSEKGPFNQLADLLHVHGIKKKTLDELRPFVTTGYVERVNINTASEEELRTLSKKITEVLAGKIKKAREVKPFTCIDDLIKIDGVDNSLIDEIRGRVTTGRNNISLDKCGLFPIDFLYIAQVPAEGGETEIEQRLARFVRDDYGLPASQRIVIHADHKGNYSNSLADAIELSRSSLDLLSTGTPMSPDTMCHSNDVKNEGYSDSDVRKLRERVENTQARLDKMVEKFKKTKVTSKVDLCLTGKRGLSLPAGTQLRHLKTKTKWALDQDTTCGPDGIANVSASTVAAGPPVKILPSADWKIVHQAVAKWCKSIESVSDSTVDKPELKLIAELLEKASRFGVSGAFPPGLDDPHLIDRFENTRQELNDRRTACQQHIESLNDKPNNVKIDLLCKAMKAIFGKSFIVLPTFVPYQPKDKPLAKAPTLVPHKPEDKPLAKAFAQYKDTLGEERLRLWLQQLAEVREPLSKFETGLMMIEAWSRESNPYSLNLAQLPYNQDRNWLGLSVEEGAEAAPDPTWIRSPLSVVVASYGELPDFSKDMETAGIIIDELIDRIPMPKVSTSIAYQYDGPNSQAPQALLLAVSSGMGNDNTIWTPAELLAIVYDTIDLAKVRAVDLDALVELPGQSSVEKEEKEETVGGILPGIYLPADPDQPGWVRSGAMKSLQEWIDTLEEAPLQCISGHLEWPEPTDRRPRLLDDSGQAWELIPHHEYETDRFAPGLDYRSPDGTYLLESAYVEVMGNVASMSHRVFYRDYKVVSYPDSFTKFSALGKANWEGAVGASGLVFECYHDGSRHLVLGRLALEVGRLPHSVFIKVKIKHKNLNLTPKFNVSTIINGYKGPDAADPVWVESYSAIAYCGIKIPRSMRDLIIKIHIPLLIGEVEERGNKFGLSGHSESLLVATRDEDRMKSFIGSKIWVARQFKDDRRYVIDPTDIGLGDEVIEYHVGEDLFHLTSYVGNVADFGLLREKDAIFRCEE